MDHRNDKIKNKKSVPPLSFFSKRVTPTTFMLSRALSDDGLIPQAGNGSTDSTMPWSLSFFWKRSQYADSESYIYNQVLRGAVGGFRAK